MVTAPGPKCHHKSEFHCYMTAIIIFSLQDARYQAYAAFLKQIGKKNCALMIVMKLAMLPLLPMLLFLKNFVDIDPKARPQFHGTLPKVCKDPNHHAFFTRSRKSFFFFSYFVLFEATHGREPAVAHLNQHSEELERLVTSLTICTGSCASTTSTSSLKTSTTIAAHRFKVVKSWLWPNEIQLGTCPSPFLISVPMTLGAASCVKSFVTLELMSHHVLHRKSYPGYDT